MGGRVAALDLYIHELTAQRMVAIFEGRLPLTDAYHRFEVPTETLDRVRQATIAGLTTVASAAFDLHVRTELGRKTFQFPDGIANAVRLCSCADLWNAVAGQLGAIPAKRNDPAKSIKKTLSIMVSRRNKIAHEGDFAASAIS